MKCPYCEKEMTSGLIGTGREALYFTADDAPRKWGFLVKNLKIQDAFSIRASQYCNVCNKLTIDLEEENNK